MKVQISQPDSYPKGLIEALSEWIEQTKDIEDVFVGLHTLEGSTPSLVAILKCTPGVANSKHQALMIDFSEVAQKFLGEQIMDMDFYGPDYAALCKGGGLRSVREF